MPERASDHIEITGKGILGRGMHVKINGQELKSCRYLKLEIGAGEWNKVTLELTPDDIDLDAEALSELVAIVDNKRKREQHGKS